MLSYSNSIIARVTRISFFESSNSFSVMTFPLRRKSVSDLVAKLNALTFKEDYEAPEKIPVADDGRSTLPPNDKDNKDENTELKVSKTYRRFQSGDIAAAEHFQPVIVAAGNILPALDFYGSPPIPPPFPKPVRWMVWSKPQNPAAELLQIPEVPQNVKDPKVRPDSHESFGVEEFTTLLGIKDTSERAQKMLQDKCQILEGKLQHEKERCDIQTQLHEKLVRTLTNAKEKTMTTVGDMLRDNEQLELRIKELTTKLKEADAERARKLQEADEKTEKAVKHYENVIKEKDQAVLKSTSEVKFLKAFAEEKDHVQASIEELRVGARNRYTQQQMELEHIHNMQMEEQQKLQGLAADRLLALTEKSYDKALENIDDNIMGIFFKNCQVQDAVAIWLQRNKDLQRDKLLLEAKIQHVLQKRKIAVKFLRHCGAKQDKLNGKLFYYKNRYDRALNFLQHGVEEFERQTEAVVPFVQKKYYSRARRLRLLENKGIADQGEALRLKRLLAEKVARKSSMEEGFLWALRNVMKKVKVEHVDDLNWEQKEMVLRRVFVYMNLQNSKKDNDKTDWQTSLTSEAEAYVDNLEQNLVDLPTIPRKTVSTRTTSTSASTKSETSQLPSSQVEPSTTYITSQPGCQPLTLIQELAQENFEELPAFGFHQPKSSLSFSQSLGKR